MGIPACQSLSGRQWTRAALACAIAVTVGCAPGCRRTPKISDDTYRQAVAAFYVSLAAMQTSQDALARRELDRLVQIVPEEPAGWANLGLLLLRQQQIDEAATRLAKAAEIAPRNAAIERLVALAASRTGNLEESIRHWRRAIELDAADLKAPYALALELERLGGAANDAEGQRLLEALAARSGNLAAQLEFARLAAKRGDAAALTKAVDALARDSSSWPADAQERLKAVRDAAQGSAGAATTPVIFLKNVLIREPAYRSALADVSTPRSEVGEPLVRFVTLRNPEPQPAAADEQLAFSAEAATALAVPEASTAGVFWLTGDARPALFAVTPRLLLFDSGFAISFLRAPVADSGPDGIAAADLNYDFRNDLVLAGSGGVAIFRQSDKAAFVNATAEAKLPPDVTRAPAYGVWPADVDTDGDLDLVVARRDASPLVLRNNGDGTFAVQSPFDSMTRARGFAWADLDGEGVPDAALLDESGALR
ncbi:MAG TPA: FG-GAP-like repeat-containing protein, partial [Vicinamibacterales bacterium]|nr:FG-GAP-like repeat-containing protein [Vicinamibacterales bacterium]